MASSGSSRAADMPRFSGRRRCTPSLGSLEHAVARRRAPHPLTYPSALSRSIVVGSTTAAAADGGRWRIAAPSLRRSSAARAGCSPMRLIVSDASVSNVYSSGWGASMYLSPAVLHEWRGAHPSSICGYSDSAYAGASSSSRPSAAARTERPSTAGAQRKPGVVEQRRQHVDGCGRRCGTPAGGNTRAAIIHGTRSVAS